MCYESPSFMLNWFTAKWSPFYRIIYHLPGSVINLRFTKPSQTLWDGWPDIGEIKVGIVFDDCSQDICGFSLLLGFCKKSAKIFFFFLQIFILSCCSQEKAMATHSSTLAWRLPGTGEPGGLPSMGLHRVGHDWSDLAAAAIRKHDKHCYFFFVFIFFLLWKRSKERMP